MTLTQLEIFATVAELGGFTAAGDRLGISQSAVSHALKGLENEWQVTLLSRSQAGIEMTDVGRGLLVRAREMLSVAEAIRQEISAVRGLNHGVLRIGSFGPTSSLQLLPRILDQYRKDYPGIDIYVEEAGDDDVAHWIHDRRVDVGFVVLPDERFDTLPLVDDQFVALVPVNHPLATRKAVSLADLCNSPFIMTTAGSTSQIEQLFASAGLHPTIKHRYSQVITIAKMVEKEEGVSIVADLALPDQVMEMCPGVFKKPLSPVAERSVGLAVRSMKHISPAVEAFLKVSGTVMKSLR